MSLSVAPPRLTPELRTTAFYFTFFMAPGAATMFLPIWLSEKGITTEQIRETVPGWTVWTHPCPGGETAQEVADRLDRVIARVRAHGGRCLVFGHGHALRVLAARWIAMAPATGAHLDLDTATLSTLGDDRGVPVILRWNY